MTEIALVKCPWDEYYWMLLVQVMAWCHQATCHYLIQCWQSSMSAYSITRLQWVNSLICVRKLTILGPDNGLSPGQCQAIIWTNAGILLIRPLETNFSEILIEIHIFSFKKMHLKTSPGKWWPFCLGLNVLSVAGIQEYYVLLPDTHITYVHGRIHFASKWRMTEKCFLVIKSFGPLCFPREKWNKPNHILCNINSIKTYVIILKATNSNIYFNLMCLMVKLWKTNEKTFISSASVK